MDLEKVVKQAVEEELRKIALLSNSEWANRWEPLGFGYTEATIWADYGYGPDQAAKTRDRGELPKSQ